MSEQREIERIKTIAISLIYGKTPIILDNLLTGSINNIAHLDKDRVIFIEHDVQDHIEIDEKSRTTSKSKFSLKIHQKSMIFE